MITRDERRRFLRRISDSGLPRAILEAVLLVLFLNLVVHIVELYMKIETRLSVSSPAKEIK